MDISILASVGSFVMSERVLKPKASVLVVLGCFLAYDLTTKTHDSSSLRVYRGPALIAFTLMMAAFSLRTWRRNGVACDELIFLPGTPHGQIHGVDTTPSNNNPNTAVGGTTSSTSPGASGNINNRNRSRSPGTRAGNGEADVAAGVASSSPPGITGVEMSPISSKKEGRNVRSRSLSREDIPGTPSSHDFAYSWDDDGDDGPALEEEGCAEMGDEDDEEVGLTSGVASSPQSRASAAGDGNNALSPPSSSIDAPHAFREARPRITRIGSFFFFRSNATSTQNATYAPSGPSVVGAAIDLSMVVLSQKNELQLLSENHDLILHSKLRQWTNQDELGNPPHLLVTPSRTK